MDSNHKASRKVSRRVVLGTAGAGALGAAAVTVGVKLAGQDETTEAAAITTDNEETTSAAGLNSDDIDDDSVVLWLVNKKRDTVMIYSGVESGFQVTDPKLAAEIKRAAKH